MSKAVLEAAGFAPLKRSPKRLIMNIQSIKKAEGKTRLALTARKPIGYIEVEVGSTEGPGDQFIPKDQDQTEDIQLVKITMGDPQYPDATLPEYAGKEGKRKYEEALSDAVKAVANPALDQFYAAYYASLEYNATTVVDSGTDFYALLRLAHFGRLEKIPQLQYAQVKRAFAKLFDDAYSFKGNVIWTHHMRDFGETVTDDKGQSKWQRTGVYEMDGCEIVTEKVQAVVQLWRENLEELDPETGMKVRFHCEVIDSRHGPFSIGTTFTNDFAFSDIARSIVGGTPEQWT